MVKRQIGLLAAAVIASLSINQGAVGQTAYLQKSNSDHMKELATKQCPESGEVTLDYYGFMAFIITSPCGLRGMFDPWRDAQPGLYDEKSGGTTGWDKVTWMEHKFPRLLIDPKHSMVDFAASTHAHFDHDGLYQFDAATVLDRMIGQWQMADFKITGLSDAHARGSDGTWPWSKTAVEWIHDPTCAKDGPMEDDNVVYYMEIGKKDPIHIVHWGDNKYDLTPGEQGVLQDPSGRRCHPSPRRFGPHRHAGPGSRRRQAVEAEGDHSLALFHQGNREPVLHCAYARQMVRLAEAQDADGQIAVQAHPQMA
jgi:hypothetical protein